MKKRMKFEKYAFLFFAGGSAYYCLEILLRGFSHFSMFFCGGICFVGCGILNESGKYEISLISQMVLSGIWITFVEFITGCIVNLWLHWNVWDYSDQPYNMNGQICLIFSIAWFFLSLIAILMDDYLRYRLFDEEKPHYKIL